MSPTFTLLRLLDPTRLFRMHRRLMFLTGATCGSGLRVTQRAELFVHGVDRQNVRFGKGAVIDGTVEVYAKGRLVVGDRFFLGRSRIYCANQIEIGNYVLISDGVAIMDSSLHPTSAVRRREIADGWSRGTFPDVYTGVDSDPVAIEDDVWIGFNACILRGVRVGRGAVIGAGAIVTKSVPAWTVVAGNPARVVKELQPE